jgi:hypothetical protein
MVPKIHCERFVVCTLGIAMITFFCFLFLLFTSVGSFEKGTLGHFLTWFALTTWNLLTSPVVFIFEKMKEPVNGWVLFIAFVAGSILYGFLIERIITLLRRK